jgi:hypothetical protein
MNRIIGYTNPLHSLGAPLVTIVSRLQEYYAIFPNCTSHKIDNSTFENIEEIEGFVKQEEYRSLKPNEYSYIDYNGIIHSGDSKHLLPHFKIDLKLVENAIHKEMLEELIFSESLKLNANKNTTQFLASEVSNNFKFIKFYTTERIKKNGEKAKRILLQHLKNGSYKTDYKKNLYNNSPFDQQDRRRFENSLNNTLDRLSGRYKISNIRDYIGNVA